jgi:tRNA pseudouridine55 synthase
MIGFLSVFKPAGPTSHDIVASARRSLPRSVKVGHCGTLDPFAEGVLVLCVGAATRLASYVQRQPKRYEAQITLGASSDTDDPTGHVTPAPGAHPPAGAATPTEQAEPSEEAVCSAVARFVGEIRQRPPAHSAVHVDGQRAYKLARRGQDVDIPERTVTVYGIEVSRYEYPFLEIDVRCGGGTYVRALARDIGAALGTAGYCSRLVRTEIGVFRADAALRPDASGRFDDLDPAKHLIAPICALADMPRIVLSEADCARIRMGKSVTIPLSTADSSKECRDTLEVALVPDLASERAILDSQGSLVAIAETDIRQGVVRPRIVLPTP